ncbi:MAG: ParA family protein [Sedimentisphaerales bacterium]|nr:ParA family protein [Sedimentisphaerales bacterium]
MMRTLAIANQKGGCGKTTTAVNLAAAAAQRGLRTLIVDLDPQAHSTIGLGLNPDRLTRTIHDALTGGQLELEEVIADTNIETLKLAPCNILLAGAELELTLVFGREFVLGEKLKTVSDRFDVCIIDCPPSLGMLTLNALVASTDVVVPVQVHYYAMEGLKQLLETVSIIRERFHPCTVKILGLLLTFVENRTTLSKQVQQQMREFFGSLVFDTVVHRTVRLAEAPSAGESIMTYAAKSRGAAEYSALAAEIFNGHAEASNLEAEADNAQADQAEETDNGRQ